MSTAIRFEDYEGLARKIAHRARRSVPSLSVEDLFQEVSVAFINACNGYDAERQVSFATYFWRVAINHLKRLAMEEYDRYSNEARSLEDRVGEDATLGEYLADDAPSPELVLSRNDAAAAALARLQPLSRLVVTWVANPPKLVVEEWRAVQARMKRGAELGERRCPPSSITLTFVMQVMGLTKLQRTMVRDDIRHKLGVII